MRATENRDYLAVFGQVLPGDLVRTMDSDGVLFMDNLDIDDKIYGRLVVPRCDATLFRIRYMISQSTWSELLNRDGFVDKLASKVYEAVRDDSTIQVIACLGYGSYSTVVGERFDDPIVTKAKSYARDLRNTPGNVSLPIFVITDHLVACYLTKSGDQYCMNHKLLYDETKAFNYDVAVDRILQTIGEVPQGVNNPRILRVYSKTNYDAEYLAMCCTHHAFLTETPSDNKRDVGFEFLDLLEYTKGGMMVVFDDWDYIFYEKDGGVYNNARLFREFARYRYRISKEASVWFLQPDDSLHNDGLNEENPYTVTVVTMPLEDLLNAYFRKEWELFNRMTIAKQGCLEILGADDLIDEVYANEDIEKRFLNKASIAAWDTQGD